MFFSFKFVKGLLIKLSSAQNYE